MSSGIGSVNVSGFKPGDRVRVIIEGTVKGEAANPFIAALGNMVPILTVDVEGKGEVVLPTSKITRVEELPAPEPVYEPGKAYQDGDGDVYIRCQSGWTSEGGGHYYDDELTYPLVELVPAGG